MSFSASFSFVWHSVKDRMWGGSSCACQFVSVVLCLFPLISVCLQVLSSQSDNDVLQSDCQSNGV